jgi:glycosyltransferase involved in cell wall biosynthesis
MYDTKLKITLINMHNPKISVIMSVCNGEEYLREAIESILNQSFNDFEFIIVNDGSNDNTLDIIKSYDDKRIRIINNAQNIGLTKSLNKALKVAKSQYIARQDADDISLSNRFEQQVRYLDTHPEVMLLGTNVFLIDELGKIKEKRIILTKPNLKNLSQLNHFNHGTTMFRKKVINSLGVYNELFKYCQDYELWIRITKKYEVSNLQNALYMLRHHNKSIGYKHIEESTLYDLLAKRTLTTNLSENLVMMIKKDNIKIFYNYLNKNEKIFFHKSRANFYMRCKNIDSARKDYREVFKLNPLDYNNYMQLILSHLGIRIWNIAQRIYVYLSTIYPLFSR